MKRLAFAVPSLLLAAATAVWACGSTAQFTGVRPLSGDAVEGAVVFPNPWRADRNDGQVIRFQAATPLDYVMVFTASGRWVRTLHCNCHLFTDWDLQNDAGQAVKSGFYLYFIKADDGSIQKGKLAVLR